MTLAARPLLWPLVPVYRLGLMMREIQFRSGLAPVRLLGWPVVSIGNLSTGGSGKTPLVIALARALVKRGVCVDVLSRGYGRLSTLPLLVELRGTADEFGDEPLVIAREANVPVYVAAERYEAGRMAEKASQQVSESGGQRIGVHLLDDGFQHRQLARDVDILLLDRVDLTDHLVPAGNLREPFHAAARAQAIAIPADEPDVEAEVRSRGWAGEFWRLRRLMDVPRIDGPVGAFCGIARPQQFFDGLEAVGVQIAARMAFPDHHRYMAQDLSRLAAEARSAGVSALFTTEKDRVRIGALAASLPPSLPLKTVQLRIEIENEVAVVDWLIDKLGSSHREPRM